MKQFRYLIILLICMVSVQCKKGFLEVPDSSKLVRETYVKDLKTTEEFLNGVYISIAQDIYDDGYLSIYPEIIADNAKGSSVTVTLLASFYKWSQTVDDASNSSMSNVWKFAYGTIRSCNFVIEKAKEFRNEDPEKADNMIAQSLAIRAMVHLINVNVFAQPYNYTADASHLGIPYITTHDYLVPVSTRNTVKEVYSNMIDDLMNSLVLFNDAGQNKTIMNKNAAKALLSRIYLFKGDYMAAKNFAREVGTAVPIMTGSDYPSLLFTQNESEALFQLLPASGTTVSTDRYNTVFQGFWFSRSTIVATNDIASLLTSDPDDLRSGWVTSTSKGWVINKFPKGVLPNFGNAANSYFETLIRSSEMYLTAAESYAKLSNEDSARYYLDAIRLRARPGASPIVATGAALLDSIYLERRKELAFEGFRMFDLLRLKKGVTRTDVMDPSYRQLPFPSNYAIAPIPSNDVLYGLPQNPY